MCSCKASTYRNSAKRSDETVRVLTCCEREWNKNKMVFFEKFTILWLFTVQCSVRSQFSCITKRYDLNIYVFWGRNYLIWYSMLCIHFGISLGFLQIYLACWTIRSRHEITTHCRHEQKERKKTRPNQISKLRQIIMKWSCLVCP